jgi:hypothetical protein
MRRKTSYYRTVMAVSSSLCRFGFVVVCLIMCAWRPATAQGPPGAVVSGTVMTGTGLVLPGASVFVVGTAPGNRFETGADEQGNFRVAGLPAGR